MGSIEVMDVFLILIMLSILISLRSRFDSSCLRDIVFRSYKPTLTPSVEPSRGEHTRSAVQRSDQIRPVRLFLFLYGPSCERQNTASIIYGSNMFRAVCSDLLYVNKAILNAESHHCRVAMTVKNCQRCASLRIVSRLFFSTVSQVMQPRRAAAYCTIALAPASVILM